MNNIKETTSSENRIIPPILHYCWFGKGEKDIISKQCMKTWSSMLKDYTFYEWTEDNVDLNSMPQYVIEAYEAHKYAFVSDYVRLLKMYEYGGVYLDTDMEICKSFDELIKPYDFAASFFQSMPMTAFFAACPHNKMIKSMLDMYEGRKFIQDDGSFDMTPIDYLFGEVCKDNGLLYNGQLQHFAENAICYPSSYFCGLDTDNWKVTYSKDTYTVHHLSGSWLSDSETSKIKIILKKYLVSLLGLHTFKKLFP